MVVVFLSHGNQHLILHAILSLRGEKSCE
uniref:Uncharacterized protein n=1 Tax=Rhizophora mucronata TaxID=61149 RepID=A0A2P2PY40_RHIMU